MEMNKKIFIFSTLALIIIAFAVYGINYEAKHNGLTSESRELILQEKGSNYVITEKRFENYYFVGTDQANGRIGLSLFRLEKNKYRWIGSRYGDENEILSHYMIIDEAPYVIFFSNKDNLDYAKVTFHFKDALGNEIEDKQEFSLNENPILAIKAWPFEIYQVEYYDHAGNVYLLDNSGKDIIE